ncbi:Ig-like domain-containing protein [Candidatus Nitrososphaera sp. FF02]|uniref:Ig-like domain-containing protein n=1 Tax=Candidatus Nitrososphaera sp. FF02 TaxID=3398226 RepID=UPI0039EB6547
MRPLKHAGYLGVLLILALAAAACFPVPPAMAAPEISLSPSEGRIGESIRIRGSDFAMISSVEITFNGVEMESVLAPLGEFSIRFEVPESQPGEATVTATDSAGNSASAEFEVINDAPVAEDLQLSVDEGGMLEVTLSASDANGDALTFEITEEPENGTLQDFDSAAGTMTYVPEPGYSGDDSFEYTASDGTDESDEATASITITSVNDPPTVESWSVSVDEGDDVEITLEGSDPEGDELTFSITDAPEHGTLSGTSPNLVYTPAPGYSGDDSLEFAAYDGEEYSDPGTVDITVLAANSPPFAADVEAETEEDETVTLYLSATDSDSDDLDFNIESTPSHGSLGTMEKTGPLTATVTYHPQHDYNGPDSFTFSVDDGDFESEAATAEIEVEPVNDAPEVAGQSVTVEAGESVQITLTGTDVDGDELDFFLVDGAERGVLGSISGGDMSATVTYTPDSDVYGSDSFTFGASDGDFDSNTATVAITIPAPAAARPEPEVETPPTSAPSSGTGQDGDAGDEEPADPVEMVPVPDAAPGATPQGAAFQSLSSSAESGAGAFASSPAVWVIPGSLLGVASVVAFLGYQEKSLKKGYFLLQEKVLGFFAQLGLIKVGMAKLKGDGWSAGNLVYSTHMSKIYRILNDEKGRAARKQLFDVQYGGARADPKEYESSKSISKKQFEEIGSILRQRPELQEPFFESFGEMTVKVWWSIKDEVLVDGRKGMQWESLEWLGGETEKYWSSQKQ